MATINGYLTENGRATVTLDGTGAGTKAVTFKESFVDAPQVLVQSRRGDAGTYSATSITKTGFTVSVSGSDITSQDINVVWIALEKA